MSGTKSNRISIILATVAVQLCLGISYIWSVFQVGISKTLFAGDAVTANLTFSFLLAMLGIGGIIGGKIVAKYSIKTVLVLSGFVISIGFIIAGFTPKEYSWLLWVGYGLLGGLGMGAIYSTTIACAQSWFPDKKGLISGVVVSALGFGGVVFTPLVEALIKYFGGAGKGEQPTFLVVSVIFLVVCLIGSLILKNPPADYLEGFNLNAPKAVVEVQSLSPMQVLKTPQFYLITLAFLFAVMGGQMMIGFAKPFGLGKGLTPEVAKLGVMIIALFNSLGRLFWGYISDKIGTKATLFTLLTLSAASSLLVNITSGYWVLVVIGAIGFMFGGFLSNFPSLTAKLFGPKNMAINYGMVMIGFGIGAVSSSFIAGHFVNIYKKTKDIGDMFPAFIYAAIFAAVAFLIISFVKVKKAENA